MEWNNQTKIPSSMCVCRAAHTTVPDRNNSLIVVSIFYVRTMVWMCIVSSSFRNSMKVRMGRNAEWAEKWLYLRFLHWKLYLDIIINTVENMQQQFKFLIISHIGNISNTSTLAAASSVRYYCCRFICSLEQYFIYGIFYCSYIFFSCATIRNGCCLPACRLI